MASAVTLVIAPLSSVKIPTCAGQPAMAMLQIAKGVTLRSCTKCRLDQKIGNR